MINTFDALARFSGDEKSNDDANTSEVEVDNNASVDLTSVIKRLNEMEVKINQLLNTALEPEIPARGKSEDIEIESEEENNASNSDI